MSCRWILLLLLLPSSLSGRIKRQSSLIPESTKAQIRSRVDSGYNPSISFGMYERGGYDYFVYGLKDVEAGLPADEETLYEIGSITKTVTALLLAMETLDGLVEIDEPVDDILQDEDIDLTDQNGVAVTLRHLTTHSSSMPRFPDNVEDSQTDPDNPYKDYSREDLFEYLRTFQPVNVGETFSYSNVAVATLGEALAIRKDRDYKEIVRNEILDVLDLGMEFEMPPDKEINFAQGYSLGPVSSWEFDALASAGALRSNIIDLLKYGVLYLDEACPLAEAMDLTKLTYFVSQDGVEHGLGWFKYEENIIEHGGATGGYLSFVGIDLVCDRVVAAMTNSGVVGVESIAKEILSGGC